MQLDGENRASDEFGDFQLKDQHHPYKTDAKRMSSYNMMNQAYQMFNKMSIVKQQNLFDRSQRCHTQDRAKRDRQDSKKSSVNTSARNSIDQETMQYSSQSYKKILNFLHMLTM